MRGEGTQGLFNALLISDISINLAEKCKFGTIQRRDMETRLSHQGKKTYGFQRNGFTTGVWSGDNQEVKIIPETDVNRNGFFLIDQWMTGLCEADDPAFCVENRFTGVHVHG